MPDVNIHLHEIEGYVRSFTRRNGSVISCCTFPDCTYGLGHDEQSIRPSGVPLYSSRHITTTELPLATSEDDEPDDALELLPIKNPELSEATEIQVENDDGTVETVLESDDPELYEIASDESGEDTLGTAEI